MRSVLSKLSAAALASLLVFGFFAIAPAASAQEYPIVEPAQAGPFGATGDEVLFVIQANNLIGEEDGAAKIQAILKAANAADAPDGIIEQIEAALAAAKAAAAAPAAGGASVPAAVAVAAPNLAFTGSSVNLPLAAGAIMVGAGGLVLLAARKREQDAA